MSPVILEGDDLAHADQNLIEIVRNSRIFNRLL